MYGLDEQIKNLIDEKIEKNKTFLKNLTFYNEDYKLVSMFDSDLNANLSPQRYYAEVANRVNTLFKLSKELQLVPVFLTVTLPSEYHKVSSNYNGYTPKKSALYLSSIWSRFLRLKIFKHIKDNCGHNMIYIRVYEPHKDGTPHLHAMVFIPKSFLRDLKKKFFVHFKKYGFKKIGLKWIDKFEHVNYDGEKGAIAYILKYMNKTFKSAKDNKMTNEAYYFAYHGIRRFITSQTLIPLWIYRKIKHNEDNRDLYLLTKDFKKGLIYTCFDKEYIIKKYLHKEVKYLDNEIIDVEHELRDKVLYQKNHFISNQFLTTSKYFERVPSVWQKNKSVSVPVFIDGVLSYCYENNTFKPYKKHISLMNDLELYNYYKNYDIENNSYVHYLAIQNLLVTRGVIVGKIYNLSNFSFKKFLF